jgi:hypothetical protein
MAGAAQSGAERSLVDEARMQAERTLLANGGELGLLGSHAAYQQVWARDSMMCSLGLLLCADPEGRAIHRRSLETLRRHQSRLGAVPHNVGRPDVADPALIAHGGTLHDVRGRSEVVDTIHAGCVDSALWYILGHYVDYAITRDVAFLESSWQSLERALLWLRYQDSNECGLLEVHEAMDWADLFANRYNVLYDNVLFAAAWRCMGTMAAALGDEKRGFEQYAGDVVRKINTVLWVGPEWPHDWEWIASERREWLYTLSRIDTELVERPFYLPYVAFRDFADRFDTLGNLLAILLGVADRAQTDKILSYLRACGLASPHPVRALHPVISPGDRDWREYYRVRNLNQPHQYHNGGAWPFIGGFYIAALVQAGRRADAARELERLAAMNRAGRTREWGFNEWFHGVSGEPMGYDGQSWSAAMYIVAHDAVLRGAPAVFNQATGWGFRGE